MNCWNMLAHESANLHFPPSVSTEQKDIPRRTAFAVLLRKADVNVNSVWKQRFGTTQLGFLIGLCG